MNPLQARRFAQSKGTRAKTDAADACMLAQMGAAFDLEPSAPMSQNLRDLKEMQVARVALIADRTPAEPAQDPDACHHQTPYHSLPDPNRAIDPRP